MVFTTLPNINQYAGAVPNAATMNEDEFADAVYPFLLYYNATFVPQLNAHGDALAQFGAEISTAIGEVQDEIGVFYSNIASYTNTQKAALDAHTTLKEQQIDAFAASKEEEIDIQIQNAYNTVNEDALKMATRAKMREFGII